MTYKFWCQGCGVLREAKQKSAKWCPSCRKKEQRRRSAERGRERRETQPKRAYHCMDCGDHVPMRFKRCPACRKILEAKRDAERRGVEFKLRNYCLVCGVEIFPRSKRRCDSCRDKIRAAAAVESQRRKAKSRPKAICPDCGGEGLRRGARCRACSDANAMKRQEAYHEWRASKKKGARFCRDCGCDLSGTRKTRCRACKKKHALERRGVERTEEQILRAEQRRIEKEAQLERQRRKVLDRVLKRKPPLENAIGARLQNLPPERLVRAIEALITEAYNGNR